MAELLKILAAATGVRGAELTLDAGQSAKLGGVAPGSEGAGGGHSWSFVVNPWSLFPNALTCLLVAPMLRSPN